ncbi:MAG: D-alanyl-D-alanine carboxypeptidase [Rhodobacteraceae bacterium]|nr:D-alanyl-D-alanine carboxypeptidase [Paracoccaceae bacterium]
MLLLYTPLWALDTIARSALVLDQTSGTVLLAKNEQMAIPPASMSKLMTLNMLFEALQDGRVSLETEFSVSAKASKKGGSKMFLREGERVSVENLIKGIIVHSGNDACIVVAENLAGSEADFARIMTARAEKLGMANSTFANATGWPDPYQRMSAADLVMLANRLMTQFPEYYGFFQEKTFTWAKITQNNRNPLLNLIGGADGLKTGHTEEAGYGLVGSARQGDRRVILMISGLASTSARAREGERLMNWAFRQFSQTTLIKAQKKITEVPVWLGQNDSVGLVAKTDIEALVPYSEKDDVKLSITYTGPLNAPVQKGAQVAELKVEIKGLATASYPLFTDADVAKSGIIKRLRTSLDVVYDLINEPTK